MKNKNLIAISVLMSLGMASTANADVALTQRHIKPPHNIPALPDVLNPNINQDTNSHYHREGPTIQVAILLDTSGSMNGLIDQARLKIWDIINEISKANKDNKQIKLEVALYEYGTNRASESNGFVRKLNGLTGDLDLLSENLFNLKTGGSQEFSGVAIKKATNQLVWSDHDDDLKLIIIAGNETFRQGFTPYEYAISKARKSNIIVNTIFCGNKHDGYNLEWSKAADLGHGQYLNINQNEKIQDIITPYDDEINRLGSELNTTFVRYGSQGKMKKERQMFQDSLSESVSSSLLASRNVAKSSNGYDSDGWDLVGNFEKDSNKAVALAKEENSELKGMSSEEIKSHLEMQLSKRNEIKSNINDLQKKRASFITEEKSKTISKDDDFGTALLRAVKEQAESKGFNFSK